MRVPFGTGSLNRTFLPCKDQVPLNCGVKDSFSEPGYGTSFSSMLSTCWRTVSESLLRAGPKSSSQTG